MTVRELIKQLLDFKIDEKIEYIHYEIKNGRPEFEIRLKEAKKKIDKPKKVEEEGFFD